MTTATQSAVTQPGPAQDETSSWEQRGTATIPAKVVAQIAAQTTCKTGNVGSDARGLLGVGARRNFASRPKTQCELYGRVTIPRLDLGLVFPTPLFSTVDDLHAHARDRVEHLTGLSVDKITVEVSWLNPSSHARESLKWEHLSRNSFVALLTVPPVSSWHYYCSRPKA